MNKLVLTSCLLFIAPGTELQVLSGLAISFLSLMFYLRILPYAEKPLRQIAFWGYLIIFLFFTTGLLIKAEVRVGANSEKFFDDFIGILLYSLVLLPCVIMLRSASGRRSTLERSTHHHRRNLRALTSRISKRLTGLMDVAAHEPASVTGLMDVAAHEPASV
jgi:hypothetical protein